jgi:phosphoribosylformylglycinamidine synthase
MAPKALVLRAAGTNCDGESVFALEQAGFAAQRVHVFRLMENPDALKEYQFLVIPGGFSYGDDIASGKILANQMLHRLADPLNQFVADGKLVLGICNGFQIMIKSGLLPWAQVKPATAHTDATLAWNECGRFEDRWIHLRADSDKCIFIPKGEVISLPIAHGEGRFVPRDQSILDTLRNQDQVALRYCDAAGATPSGMGAPPMSNTGGSAVELPAERSDAKSASAGRSEAKPAPFPINPNGSVDDIAGLCDPTGRVMGLMPHPERFVDITQHPQWTRGQVKRADGKLFFQRAFEYLK